jgi:hypothetical protein
VDGQPTGSASCLSGLVGRAYFSEDEIWDSDKSVSDGFYCNTWDEGWDTDDEVEEANAADDMVKIIEGDWER